MVQELSLFKKKMPKMLLIVVPIAYLGLTFFYVFQEIWKVGGSL